MIKANTDILATDFIIATTAGEALSARDAVYISTADGKAYKCDADDVTKIGFVGFAQEAAALNAAVNIINSGVATGFSGLTIGAQYFVSATAGAITTTKPTNYKIVGTAVSATVIRIADYLTERVTTYLPNSLNGGETTQFDITNTAGSTYRYTWDGTGTDPVINAGTFPIGTVVDIYSANMAAVNSGFFTVTGVGANYFEVTNASGVAEINKTLGQSGYLLKGAVYTKTGGLRYAIIKGVGAGGNGSGASANRAAGGGGGGAGYFEKCFTASELGATENLIVGKPATGTGDNPANKGSRTIFGTASLLISNGGLSGTVNAQGGLGGTATGGDINIPGSDGGYPDVGYSGSSTLYRPGSGGASFLGASVIGNTSTGNPGVAGYLYGSGGSGANATGGGGAQNGGTGADGVLIITEYY